jgi:hypothetical protein
MARPKGSKNKPKLRLTAEVSEQTKKPTGAQRMQAMKRQVVLMVADQMSPETIAAVMEMALDKLTALFGHELKHGRAIVRAEELMRLDSASAEGKVSASKIILQTAAADRPAAPNTAIDKNDNAKITRMALSVLNGGKK